MGRHRLLLRAGVTGTLGWRGVSFPGPDPGCTSFTALCAVVDQGRAACCPGLKLRLGVTVEELSGNEDRSAVAVFNVIQKESSASSSRCD